MKENLKKWQIQLDVTCSLCDESKEDTMHALWLCDQAQSVWKSEASFVYLYQRKFRTFMDLFEAVLDRGSVFKVAWFSTIAWSLWQRRNRIKERQQTWPLHEVSRRAKEMVLEFFEINRKPIQPVRRSAPTYWHPPQEGTYKVNFDAALFDDLGMAGLGVVVRDSTGNIIAALSQKVRCHHSVEMVEALACNRALVFAQELCLSQVVFEGDSLRIVQAVNSQAACSTLFGHVVEEIKNLRRGLSFSCFQHVKRDGNKLAHSLARRAVSSVDTDVWVEELPSDLEDVFQFDFDHQ